MVRHHISLSFLLLPLFMEYHRETVSQCLSCAIYLQPEIFQNFSILSNQKLRMDYVLLIYFEQIVSFCAIIYSNTNSRQLF